MVERNGVAVRRHHDLPADLDPRSGGQAHEPFRGAHDQGVNSARVLVDGDRKVMQPAQLPAIGQANRAAFDLGQINLRA
jgi:hypothetical protein